MRSPPGPFLGPSLAVCHTPRFMPIAFRPFEPEQDFDLLARFWTQDNPDWPMSGLELVRKESQRNPEHPMVRWIGELDGQAVCGFGYGDQDWAHREGRKYIGWYFDPAYATESRRAILAESERLLRQDGSDELNAWSRDDRPETLAALKAFGYAQIERQPVTRLDLAAFDPKPFQSAMAKVAGQGLRLASMAELDAEGYDWIPEHYEATWEMVQDIPMAQPPTRPTKSNFRMWLEDRDLYDRDLMFAVLEGRTIAGYTRLIASDLDAGFLFTGLTGVRRAYRRRGLATAVKVHSLIQLQARGAHTVQTDNLDTNPMLDLNLRLGYRPQFAWLHYVKRF